MVPDLRHTLRDTDAFQTVAAGKHVTGKLRNPAGKRYRAKPLAGSKRILSDLRHRLRNADLFKTGAAVERVLSNLCHGIGYRKALQRGTVVKQIRAKLCHAIRDTDFRQRSAAVERILPDLRHTGRNHDIRQRRAAVKRVFPYFCHRIAVGERNARQIHTFIKSVIADIGHTAANRHCNDHIPVTVPRNVILIRKRGHRTGTCNGQSPVIVKFPGQIISAGPLIHESQDKLCLRFGLCLSLIDQLFVLRRGVFPVSETAKIHAASRHITA